MEVYYNLQSDHNFMFFITFATLHYVYHVTILLRGYILCIPTKHLIIILFARGVDLIQ